MGRKPLRQAVLEGASQIAVPTLVSTLTICIVFVAVLFLTGPAQYLFAPMALAVIFAMIASYVLSRTLVPVHVGFFLAGLANEQHEVDPATGVSAAAAHNPNMIERLNARFNAQYVKLRGAYTNVLRAFLTHRALAFTLTGAIVASAFILLPFVGRDFFPNVDAGQIRLHVRGTPGTRIEDTKIFFSQVEDEIRRVIPTSELALVLDDIGRPAESFNFGFSDGSTIGTF